MNVLTELDRWMLVYVAAASALAFLLFAYDKVKAGRGGRRVPERRLLALAALGGWPGGLLGMCLLRHKTSKPRFQWKYAAALLPFAALVAAYLLQR